METDENTPFGPPNSPPPSTIFPHYKKLTHAFTFSSQNHANALLDSNLTSLSSPPPPHRKLHIILPKIWAYNSLISRFAKIVTPLPLLNLKKKNTNPR